MISRGNSARSPSGHCPGSRGRLTSADITEHALSTVATQNTPTSLQVPTPRETSTSHALRTTSRASGISIPSTRSGVTTATARSGMRGQNAKWNSRKQLGAPGYDAKASSMGLAGGGRGRLSEEEKRLEFDKYRGEARTRAAAGKYEIAIEMYTQALEYQPQSAECLLARAQCYLEVSDYEDALKDAEETLKINNKQPKGYYIKAEAHYQRGEFEFALVCFHRAKRLRPGLPEYDRGVKKSEAAIEASLGEHTGAKLSLTGDLSYFENQKAVGQRSIELLARQTSGQRREALARWQQRDHDQAGRKDPKTVKQLLGDLYGDWQYLEEILNDEDEELVSLEDEARAEEQKRRKLIKEKRDALKGGNPLKQVEEDEDKLVPRDRYSEAHRRKRREFSESMRRMGQKEMGYLSERADFWMQQRPPRRAPREAKSQRSEVNRIMQAMEDIEDGLGQGKHKEGLARGTRLLREIESSQTLAEGRRQELLGTVHSLVGNAHYELAQYDRALDSHRRDLDIAESRDLSDAKSRALDNMGRTYAKNGAYSRAIDMFEQKLPLVTTSLESTWLYHELGRCYLETGNYSEAQACAEKAAESANRTDDRAWQLNASVLRAQAEVELENYDDALEAFDKAYSIADMDGDTEAKSVISKAIDDLKRKLGRNDHPMDTIESESAEDQSTEPASGLPEDSPSEAATSSPARSRSPEQARVASPREENNLPQESSPEHRSSPGNQMSETPEQTSPSESPEHKLSD